MDKTQMQVMSVDIGELPMEQTLCCFQFIGPKGKELFLLGSLVFINNAFHVKEYSKDRYLIAKNFTAFQYIYNENGGFYFLKNK